MVRGTIISKFMTVTDSVYELLDQIEKTVMLMTLLLISKAFKEVTTFQTPFSC